MSPAVPTPTSISTATATEPARTRPPATRPSRLRRGGLVLAGVLACALPTVFAVNLTRMLLVGELPEHRFHQLTGQGLLLCVLWLAGLVPLLRAGWAGVRPSTAAGVLHLAFVATAAVCATAATGGGAPALVAVLAVTGGFVWAALPTRPRLRPGVRVDPVRAPLALVAAAVTTPYLLDQVALQNAATGHHAENPHFFDMAWLVAALVVLGLLGSLAPELRRLAVLAAAGLAWTGAVGAVLDVDRPWAVPALVLGVGSLVLPALLERGSGPTSRAASVL